MQVTVVDSLFGTSIATTVTLVCSNKSYSRENRTSPFGDCVILTDGTTSPSRQDFRWWPFFRLAHPLCVSTWKTASRLLHVCLVSWSLQSCGCVHAKTTTSALYWLMNHHTSKSNHTRVHVHQKIPRTSSIVKSVLHTQNLACPHCTSQVLTAFLTLVTSPHFSRFSLLFHAVGYGRRESLYVPSVQSAQLL